MKVPKLCRTHIEGGDLFAARISSTASPSHTHQTSRSATTRLIKYEDTARRRNVTIERPIGGTQDVALPATVFLDNGRCKKQENAESWPVIGRATRGFGLSEA